MTNEQVFDITTSLEILHKRYRTGKYIFENGTHIEFNNDYITISPSNTKFAIHYYKGYGKKIKLENQRKLKAWNENTYKILILILQEHLIEVV